MAGEAIRETEQQDASTANPQAVLEAAAQASAWALDVQEVSIWLHDASADVLRIAARVPAAEWVTEAAVPVGDSLLGRVLRSGQPFQTRHLTRDSPGTAWLAQAGPWQSGLFLPIFEFPNETTPLGVLEALSSRERVFSEEDVQLVQALTWPVAMAIQHARLLEDAQRRANQLATILAVNRRLVLGRPLKEILAVIPEVAARLLGVEAAGLVFVERNELAPVASFGPAEATMIREGLRAGRGLSDLVVKEGRPIVSINPAEDPRLGRAHRAQVRTEGIRAWLGVPLRARDQVVGVMFVADRTERNFDQTDIEILEAYAAQAAIAIENARLYRALAEREGRLHQLVGRLLLAQEEARRRVAYDVHDGLAQVAAAVQQHLEVLAARYRPRSADLRQELELARELAQRTVSEARRVIAGLRPTALDDFGLPVALRREVDALRSKGWEISYEEKLGLERLPPPLETALFRVAQEALENVRKHARTTRVQLTLERHGQTVRLEVRDWGRGFRPSVVLAGANPSQRVGLAGMQERITWLGGQCIVRSRPGAGTRIVVEVPLSKAQEGRIADDG